MPVFYKANDSYNASLTADYTAGDATHNVNTVPENVPTIVTVGRGTAKETRFYVTGTASGQLTGVSRKEGANENISSGASVECMIDDDFVNQLESAVFDQSGLKGLIYAADGGSDDAYEITLPVAPSDFADITGVPIIFKANTVNTGPATLDVNALGPIAIKKLATQDLATGDILEDQTVLVVYDGTFFQLLGDVPIDTVFSLTVNTIASSATPSPIIKTQRNLFTITALAAASAIGVPTGTPTEGMTLALRIKDNATARALTFNAVYRFSADLPAPTTTTISKTLYVGFIYNNTASKWDCLAILDNLT